MIDFVKRGFIPLFLSAFFYSTKVVALDSLAAENALAQRALVQWDSNSLMRSQFKQLLRLKPNAQVLADNTLSSSAPEKFYLSDLASSVREEFLALVSKDINSIQCRFPARVYWLSIHHLTATPDFSNCSGMLELSEIQKHPNLSVVFSSYNLDYPSSAFGHTFLRLSDGSIYDGFAIGFSVLNTKLDMATAFRTLIGTAEGQFTVEPYVTKRTEYLLTESRDLWESPLATSQEASAMIIYHVAELKQIPLYYSYFSRNCASEIYHLMSLVASFTNKSSLLSARESHHSFELPIHVVKNLASDQLQLTPSNRRKIEEHRYLHHNSQAAQSIYEWSHRGFRNSPLFALSDFEALDFAREVLQVKVYEDDSPQINEELWKIRRKLKSFKSEEESSIDRRPQAELSKDLYSPYRTHSTSKFSFGAELAHRHGISVSYRPALHGPTDPKRGYDSANHIEMGNTQFVLSDSNLYLKEFTFYKINSTERSPFTKNLSWASELTHQSRRWNAQWGESFVNGQLGRAWNWKKSTVHLLGSLESGVTEKKIGSGVRSGYVRLFPEVKWTFGFGHQFNGFASIRPFDSIKAIRSFEHLQLRVDLQWTAESEWFIGVSYNSLGNIFTSQSSGRSESTDSQPFQLLSVNTGSFF